MRYKKFQISGAVDLDEIDMLWIRDINIVDGSILQKDRVKEEDLESHGRFKGLYEYLKVDKYLYRRVDTDSNIDEDYGNATTYCYVLPESHPSFNFDILYNASRYDKAIAMFTDNDRGDEGRTVLHRYLSEFVNRNTYE